MLSLEKYAHIVILFFMENISHTNAYRFRNRTFSFYFVDFAGFGDMRSRKNYGISSFFCLVKSLVRNVHKF